MIMLLLLAGLGMALSNGANDNGKPVASLIGSAALIPALAALSLKGLS